MYRGGVATLNGLKNSITLHVRSLTTDQLRSVEHTFHRPEVLQSESVGRRNSRTTFLRSDWPRPFARREVGVEMELGRSENKRPEQRRS
ncbi:hypothetical protein TNCV_3608391 [Trichonephila clavipes]|nr:hypothetical protein TNCV_3608391 [Trichonephila clavipes]